MTFHSTLPRFLQVLATGMLISSAHAAPDTLFADFEGDNYGTWKVEGTAFGTAPARGKLNGQMDVGGFAGQGLANSFLGGDDARGKLISPTFTITQPYISFLIGGGGYLDLLGLHLVVDGKRVRSAAGPNLRSGGSENLKASGWDVRELKGKSAHLEIEDNATGGWGHINVDQIVFTNTKPPLHKPMQLNAKRNIKIDGRWLRFPVKNGGDSRVVTVKANGQEVRRFDIELADETADWQAPLDVSAWKGQVLEVEVNMLPAESRGLSQIQNSNQRGDEANLYREPLRGQFHFSPKRGWLNDPNGMVFYNGEYHLFFQHNPYGWSWGNMHWGHATSRDLVHWTEHGEALYPDKFGPMFSGSGVVDWKNTSGLGKNSRPPMVLFYTAAGNSTVQGLAWSNDGRTFAKLPDNPIIGEITNGNRDPKVIWHEPTKRWVMVLYVELNKEHTVHFFTSPDLKKWELASVLSGKNQGGYLFECPDLFPLNLDGDPKQQRWVILGADSVYAIGDFDGKTFTPQTGPLPGQRGRDFYAAQTFSDEPKNRRVQIGWWRTATPGMAFNQSMSLPMELKLISTPEGPRMTWTPVRELENLRDKSHTFQNIPLGENAPNPLEKLRGDLWEIRAEIEPESAREIHFDVRGVPVILDVAKNEIAVNGHRAPLPARNTTQNGKMDVQIFADRIGLEVFAANGRVFVPIPVNLDAKNQTLKVSTVGGNAKITALQAHQLRSAWNQKRN